MQPFPLIVVTIFMFSIPVSETEKMWCSIYLLSGFSGVPNEAFTASSSFTGQDDFSPDNARLYFERPNLNSGAGWCSNDINDASFIQVQLDTEAIVDSVSIQGRGDYPQWVKTFHILYSTDNATWTRVMSPDNNPELFSGNTDALVTQVISPPITAKYFRINARSWQSRPCLRSDLGLFTGNTNRNTVVRQVISPPITAKYFRINARSWQSRPCLRFDLGGCTLQPKVLGRFALASLPSMTALGQSLSLQPPGPTFHHCGIACHRQTGCLSFRYDVMFQTCHGYTSIRKTSFSRQEIPYYYNTVLNRGYKHSESGNFSYKVIELRQNQVNASESCVSQVSFLLKVGTLERLTLVQAEIQQNNLLKQDFQFYVSGEYTIQWQYSDGDVIDSTLWSPSNPDPAQGHCVMLTQNGLSSVNCTMPLFFICEY